jgi:hypothetical protein
LKSRKSSIEFAENGIDTYFAISKMLKRRDPSRRNRLSVPVFQHPAIRV